MRVGENSSAFPISSSHFLWTSGWPWWALHTVPQRPQGTGHVAGRVESGLLLQHSLGPALASRTVPSRVAIEEEAKASRETL